MSRKRRWIQQALAKHKTGALHQSLGIPDDEIIPVEILREAAAHPERFKATAIAKRLLARRARLVLTLRGFRKKRT